MLEGTGGEIVAEYSEVIKQFKRMCRYTNRNGSPNDCPLYCKGHGCNISHCRLLAFEDKKFQNVVMAWAAEHPEPVYPTWRDALLKCGLLYEQRDNKSGSREIKPNWPEMAKPIPADIAQKLGIEPKEKNMS